MSGGDWPLVRGGKTMIVPPLMVHKKISAAGCGSIGGGNGFGGDSSKQMSINSGITYIKNAEWASLSKLHSGVGFLPGYGRVGLSVKNGLKNRRLKSKLKFALRCLFP